MIYLSGVVHPPILGLRRDLGVMLTPRMRNAPQLGDTPWAADTGCFRSPGEFDLGRYLLFLAARGHWRGNCLFATAPDVVGDPVATWERSEAVLPRLRQLGFPAALVAQDGLEAPPWSAFDVLFLGGSTAWKLSNCARRLAEGACSRGVPVHMGRVNSLRRLRTAAMKGCTSADGTFLAFAPDTNLPRMTHWLDSLIREPVLNFGGADAGEI